MYVPCAKRRIKNKKSICLYCKQTIERRKSPEKIESSKQHRECRVEKVYTK